MKQPSSFVIAIAGGSGSGKSLLCQALRHQFGPAATAFPFDAYNKDQSHLTLAERNALNYDIPDAYDIDRYLADLLLLKDGKTIALPTFDYASHTRCAKTLSLPSAPIIITEGFLVLAIPESHRYFDFTIYVDADGDVRLARRILRDQKERGYPPEQVIEQYLSSVKPMHEKYIEPGKARADFVFANNGRAGLDPAEMKRLITILHKKIAERENR